MPISLHINSKEIGNGPLDCDLESCCLHVLYHLQKLSMLWASEDGIVGVEDIHEILLDEDAWASGQLNEANALELLDQMQQPNPASLFLAVDVPQDLLDVVPL